jgi:hypothetical protein
MRAALYLPFRRKERCDLGSDSQARQVLVAYAQDLSTVAERAPQMNAGAKMLGHGRLPPRVTAARHDIERAKAVLEHYMNAAASDEGVLHAFDPVVAMRRGGDERSVGAD